MPSRLTDLNVNFVSLVDRAAVRDPTRPTEPQRFLVWKNESAQAAVDPTPEPQGGPMTAEELQSALTKAQEERDAALEATAQKSEELAKAEQELAKARAANGRFQSRTNDSDDDDDDDDDVKKADLPPAVRARLEKAENEAAELRKAASEAHEIAKAEREIRVTREYVAKAQDYQALPIDASVFGPVLKSCAEKLTKDEADELTRVLKAADEQIATSGLFKEHGRGGDGHPAEGETSLARKADEIRKSDPSLSPYEAMRRAMREDPSAQAQYLQSVR